MDIAVSYSCSYISPDNVLGCTRNIGTNTRVWLALITKCIPLWLVNLVWSGTIIDFITECYDFFSSIWFCCGFCVACYMPHCSLVPVTRRRKQILNRQTFKALPACELIDLSSLVGRSYAESALKVLRFNIFWPLECIRFIK